MLGGTLDTILSDDIVYVDPLSAAGIPPHNILKKLIPFLKGYPMCLYCPGELHKIQKPNIKKLVEEDLPEFMGADIVRLHHGAREGAFLVLFSLYKYHIKDKKDRAPIVVQDGNTHYSMILAAERAMLDVVLTETTEAPQFKVDIDSFQRKIEEVKEKYGKKPLAILVNYPDGKYGNLLDLKEISKIAKENEIYLIVDCAYSIGRMPFDMRGYGVDAVLASAHKSMACIGPLGVIGMTEELAKVITQKSRYRKDKEVEFLGCTARGIPTICLMYVMEYLEERVKKWDEKVKIANYFIERAEKELNFTLQGEKPHYHDLLNFKTDNLYRISLTRNRYFLYKELKKRKIFGVKPGITKTVKLSTYLLDKEKANYVIDAFAEILKV